MFFKFLSSRCSCSRSAAARRACNSPAGPGMRMCVCLSLSLSPALSLVLNDLLFVRSFLREGEGKEKFFFFFGSAISTAFRLLVKVLLRCSTLSTLVANVFLSCFYCYSLISFSHASSSSSSLPQDFPRRRSFPLRLRCPRIGRFGRWRC